MNQDHEAQPQLDAADEARVTAALNSLEVLETPSTFVARVVWGTKQSDVRLRQQRQSRRPGVRMISAKSAVVGLIGIAAAGLIVVYVGGFPPASQTEGTIGAAQRYRAQQIDKADVKVGDAKLQAFMQTDVFDKLIHDKSALAALASSDVQAALASADLAQALSSEALQGAMASAQFQQTLSGQGVQAAIASSAFQQALQSSAVLQAAVSSSAFQAAIASPAFQAAIASPAFQQALQSSAFSQGVSASFFQGLQQQALQSSDIKRN